MPETITPPTGTPTIHTLEELGVVIHNNMRSLRASGVQNDEILAREAARAAETVLRADTKPGWFIIGGWSVKLTPSKIGSAVVCIRGAYSAAGPVKRIRYVSEASSTLMKKDPRGRYEVADD